MKIKTIYFFLITTVIILSVGNSFGQTEVQKAEMEKLSGFLGEWKLLTYEIDEEGNWKAGKETSSKVTSFFGGAFFEEKSQVIGPNSEINLRSTFGYLTGLKKYRISVVDKEYAVFDIYEGNIQNGALVVNNLDSRTPFIGRDGITYHFKLSYTIPENDSFSLLIDFSTDGGKTWGKYQKVEYTRKK